MSTERIEGRIVFSCDVCGDEQFSGEPGQEFNEAWDAAKREGWRARKIARDWLHACPDCRLDQ